MVKIETIDINSLIEKWSDTKKELSVIQAKLDKYKKTIHKIMDFYGKTNISNENNMIVRKNMSRTTITKRDLPEDIWEEYSKTINYSALYLKKIKK